jgi:hypothetical protein
MSLPWAVAFVALWALVVVLAVVVLGLLRRVAPILAQAEQALGRSAAGLDPGGLPPGEEVPPFEVLDGAGERLRPGDSLPLPAVFLFVEGGCGPCQSLMAEIQERAPAFAGTRLYVVPADPENGKYDALRGRGITVLKQEGGQVSAAFRQTAFPHAFAVDGDRRVARSEIPGSVDQLKDLAREVGADGHTPGKIVGFDRATGKEGQARGYETREASGR